MTLTGGAISIRQKYIYVLIEYSSQDDIVPRRCHV